MDAPRWLGLYTDLSLHAKGGLGEVLKAVDSDLHRTVAIKRLQSRLADDPVSQRRFMLEAEITARLEHPGVVPVYSLFQGEQGRPCYSMRFIEGQTLAEAIKAFHAGPAEPVGFRRLLQSFIQVCQTIAYANSRGVIHRDIKPGNVMLGKFGETLVVDWGLSKVVGRPDELRAVSPEVTLQPVGSGSGSDTALGSAVGTPAYMSPEQAAGRWDVIDVASDIYSLGAVLYTLLTGKPPFEKGNWPEIQQKIQRADYLRPRETKKDVPSALEAICLKAMALEPDDRYPSASALAGDIEHWLADEPVTARREPALVRLARWGRRNKTFVVGAIAALLVGVVALGIGTLLLGQKNQQVRTERDKAQEAETQAKMEAAKNKAISRFLTEELLGQASPERNARGLKLTVEQLLDRVAKKIDEKPDLAGGPETEATVRLTIGETYFKLDELRRAEPQLRRALKLRQEVLGPSHPETLTAQEALAVFLIEGSRQLKEGVPLAKLTWESREHELGSDNNDTLTSMRTYSVGLFYQRRLSDAENVALRCWQIQKDTRGSTDPETMKSLAELGLDISYQGRFSEADSPLHDSYISARDHYGPEHGDTISRLNNYALNLYFLNKLAEAERLLTEGVNTCRRVYWEKHDYTLHLQNLLSQVLLDEHKLDDAEKLARETLAIRREVLNDSDERLGLTLLVLGRILAEKKQMAAAKKLLEESLEVFRKGQTKRNELPAEANVWLGACLIAEKQFAAAEPRISAGLDVLFKEPRVTSRQKQNAQVLLLKLYDAWPKPDKAAELRKKMESVPKPK